MPFFEISKFVDRGYRYRNGPPRIPAADHGTLQIALLAGGGSGLTAKEGIGCPGGNGGNGLPFVLCAS
jgi:hypothetical protein